MIVADVCRFDRGERVIIVTRFVLVVVFVLLAIRTVPMSDAMRMCVRMTDVGVEPWPEKRNTAKKGRKKPGKR